MQLKRKKIAISDLFLKDFLSAETRDELNKIKEVEQETKRDHQIYKTSDKKRVKHMIFKRLRL